MTIYNNKMNVDDINVFTLISVCWKRKLLILIITSISVLISVAYALLVQQWWTADSIIIKGNQFSSSIIKEQLPNLYVALNDVDNKDINKLNNLLEPEVIFKKYVTQFNAYNNKVDFIRNNKELHAISVENGVSTELDISKFEETWAKKISASVLDPKFPNEYTLKFTATTPELSAKLLKDYSLIISNEIKREIFHALSVLINNVKTENLIMYSSLVKNAQSQRDIEIFKTKNALLISKSAGVIKPISDMGNQLFPIDIGSKGLEEQLKILKVMDDYSFFDSNIEQVQNKIDLLSSMKLDENIQFKGYQTLKNISVPSNRDAPNRKLIVFIGLLIGFLLSLLTVFSLECKNTKE
ncbi:hypothetical protein ACEI25_003685 [Photobacterium damselae]